MRPATTPFLVEHSTPDLSDEYDDEFTPTDGDVEAAAAALRSASEGQLGRQLKPYAAKVLMKVLYAARYARFDLLNTVCYLAQYDTKWDEACDRRLYWLMCYINSTLHYRMTGWVGDDIADVSPHLFADADFAGDAKTSRSTSGLHLTLLGPSTVFPLQGQCKKQGCVSNSTPEAETVAAAHALRMFGLPSLDLWSTLFLRPVTLDFHEDNETAVGAMRTGHSPALRNIKRTHGVCLRWLAERFAQPDVKLYYERSVLQAADVYTKGFTVPAEWDRVVRLINLLDPVRFWGSDRTVSAGQMGSEHKGGVSFTYWTPNPWQGRDSQAMPAHDYSCGVATVAPARYCDSGQRDAHVSWIVPPTGVGDTSAVAHHAVAVVSCSDAVEDHHCDYYYYYC